MGYAARFLVLSLALLMMGGAASALSCDLEAQQYDGQSLSYTIMGRQYVIATSVTDTTATFTVNGATSPPLSQGQAATVGNLSVSPMLFNGQGSGKPGIHFCANSTIVVACTDSDGGANHGTQGTTQNALGTTRIDSCSSRTLTEWVCSPNGNVLSSTQNCPYGCNAGACLTATTVCYRNIQNLPAKCEGGTVTQDEQSGSCRTIACAGAGGSLKVLACEKPDGSTPQHFEMYKQSQTGSGVKVCIGTTCMKDEGFVRSGSFPVCIDHAPPACTPSAEVCDGKDNDCDAQVDEGDVCALKGNVDIFTSGSVQGWTYDPASSSSAIDVRISVDGATRAQFPTNLTRGDVNSAFNITGAHGFNYPWSGICGTHNVTVSAISGAKTLTLRTGQLSFGACGPVQTDNAQFVSQSVPSAMVPGQQYDVSVTVKNTGTTTWTKAAGYKLGSQHPQDNTVWGMGRVLLSDSDSIAPNATKTFSFKVTAPSTAGTYHFQWRMVKEGVAWFGDLTPDTSIEVQGTSACASRVKDMPVTCDGGTITRDEAGGCRAITCTSGEKSATPSTLSVLACDKPDTGSPQHFEMYKQGQTGSTQLRLCLGETCIAGNGYAKSPSYPICTGPAPVSAEIAILEPFPADQAFAFSCETPGVNATSWSWSFGDGTTTVTRTGTRTYSTGNPYGPASVQNKDVYHRFLASGNYEVTCTASDGTRTASGTRTVQVVSQAQTSASAQRLSGLRYRLTCDPAEYGLTRYYSGTVWSIENSSGGVIFSNAPYGESSLTLDYDFPAAGKYNISCRPRSSDDRFRPAYWQGDAGGYTPCSSPGGCVDSSSPETQVLVTDIAPTSATLRVAPWFPQGRNYVFICEAQGFTATSYDWDFGDGQGMSGVSNRDVYHSYAAAGGYDVSCTAKSATQSETGTLKVAVA